jgi:hypothetical protein
MFQRLSPGTTLWYVALPHAAAVFVLAGTALDDGLATAFFAVLGAASDVPGTTVRVVIANRKAMAAILRPVF